MSDSQGTDMDFTIEAAYEADPTVMRVYEIGYHITPSIKEEDVEKVVAAIRAEIEKHQGSFIAEGAPALVRLAYPIEVREGGKFVEYDRGYFGWIKFEAPVATANALNAYLMGNTSVLRHIMFKTLREDTRAQLKVSGLREVKRTDTIKTTPRREVAADAPVSEEELDKALEGITAE